MTAVAAMIGNQYGRWTVVGDAKFTPRGERKWLCRCACGTERYVLERSLVYGGSVSCGCLRIERANQVNTHDITGRTFGHLTALHPIEKKTKNGGIWWLCQCSCGNTCEVIASLLVKGRKTHCGCKTEKQYSFADITGQRFNRLTALYPTEKRTARGGIVWHCRCDCGNELDVPYNELAFTNRQSCGCQKKEHDEMLPGFLTHVAGTSVDHLKSKKLPISNTTGVKGVYLIRGKYVAKIVFQKTQYYLGAYRKLEDAAEARREAEEILAAGTVKHYERWKARADLDPEWAEANPIQIHVDRHSGGEFSILFLPVMEESITAGGCSESKDYSIS